MSETLQKPAEAEPIAAKTNHSPIWRARWRLWPRPGLGNVEIGQESQT